MTTKSRSVVGGRREGVRSATALLAAVAGTALTSVALAGPEGATVVRGNVQIERQGQQTIIRAGDRSIINYRSFDIGSLESVRFIQPSADSRVLNRIQSASPTRIDGNLSSNGRVYIVNPAGVIFGNNAVVNVGGIFAAAGHMSNNDFVRGVDRVTGMKGEVRNDGTITTPGGGTVVLAGGSVVNSGSIVAPQGTVAFAAGDGVVMGNRGSNLYVRVDGEAASDKGSGVTNTGTVDARNGRVVMAAGDVYGMAINSRGSISARDIELDGQGTGNVVVGGTLDASNQRIAGGRTAWAPTGAFGGNIRIVGENVAVANATIDASGANGGGNVEIGGGLRGSGDFTKSQVTAVNSGTTIRADATQNGNGGTVVVWADNTTKSYADISARGGTQGGNGGTIETSGKQHLTVDGSGIDASARATGAKGGTWLMDPHNVTITANPTSVDGDFTIADPSVFTPASDDTNVFAGDIESRLDSGTSVTITTGSTGIQDGDITVTTNITSNSAGVTPTLRLEAANSVILDNADITAAGGTSLNVDLVSNHSAGIDPGPTVGAVKLINGSSIVTNGGNIRIGGGTGTFAALTTPGSSGYDTALLDSAARGTTTDTAGVLLDNATLDAGTGSIDVRGAGTRNVGAVGVQLSNGSTITGAGVAIHGAGGIGATANGSSGVVVASGTSVTAGDGGLGIFGLGRGDQSGYGVQIRGSASTTGTGAINVIGASEATGDASHGVFVDQGTISSTGSGNVAVTGIGAGTTQSDGVRMENGQILSSGAGDIAVTGSGSGTSGVGVALEGFAPNEIGGASMTGDVTITTDRISLPQADINGQGGLAVRTFTSGTTMGVGTGAAGTLSLNDAALATFSGFDSFSFGGATTGLITTAALDFSAAGVNATFRGAGMNTAGITLGSGQSLTLNMTGGVTQTGAIIAPELLLLGSGNMTLLNVDNDVDVLAGNITGNVRFVDTDAFQIGQVDSTIGLATTTGLELTARSGTLDVAQPLTISSGGVTLLADEIDITGTISGTGSLFLAPFLADTDVRVGHAADGGAGLDLTASELANISGVSLLGIGLEAGTGTLTVPEAYTFNRYTVLRMGGTGGVVNLQAAVRSTGGGLALFGATNRIGGNITAVSGDVVINGPTLLDANVVVDATDGGAFAAGGNVQLRGTINADAVANNRTLTVTNGTSGVSLGNVGANDALASVTVNAGAITLADVRTTGGQTYNGPTSLHGHLDSITTGDIFFQNTLALTGDSGISTGGNAGDDVIFRGAVTGSSDLLVATGDGNAVLFGDVSGDDVRFDDAVVLERDVTINGTTSVRLLGTVDSFANEANDLTVNSPTTVFGGAIGAGTNGVLGALRTDSTGTTTINGGQVLAQNGINLLDNVVLGAGTTVTSNTAGVEFGGTIQSDGSPRALTVNAPTGAIFRAGIGTDSSLASLTVVGAGTLGGNVTTTGAQNYQNLTLAGDVTINASALTVAGTLNSDSSTNFRDLIVATGVGNSVFGGVIGGVNALDTIEVTSGNISLGQVTTRGGQRYAGPTTLSGNVRSTTSGPVTFAGDLLITTDVTIASAGAAASDDVNFQGKVDSHTTSHNLTVSAGAGDVLFSDAVGTTTGEQAIATFNVSGASVGLRNVKTTRSQVYTGATSLNGNLTTTGQGAIAIGGALTLQSDATVTTAQGDVVFGGTVNSDSTARALTVNTGTSGTTRFVSAVGNNFRLASLTTNADGVTRIEGGQVRTTGDQTYGDNVVLGTNVTMEANDVSFSGTVNSDSVATPRNLTVNSAVNSTTSTDTGETAFAGVVGGAARLGLLTTNADGSTRFGDSVFTSRGLNIQDAAVLVGGNITIDGGSGPITFRSTLNADSTVTDPNLVLLSSAAGDADNPAFRFGGNIGSVKRLGSLAIGADRATVQAGSVIFTDALDSNGRIVKANVATTDAFTVTTGTGGFSVGGGHKVVALGSLTITTTGAARFGDVTALNNFTVNAGSIALRRRAGNLVQTPTSSNFGATTPDSGTDLVAGGIINFNVAPTFEGTGGVMAYSTGSRQQDPELSGIVYREPLVGIDTSRFNDPRNSTLLLGLDLIASGPSSTQIAPATTLRTPPISAPPEDLTRAELPADLALELADLGVPINPRGMQNILDGLSGRNFDSDLPASVGPEGLAWQVNAQRIDTRAARGVIDEYRTLMFAQQTGDDGKTVMVSRADVVRESLSQSWDRYATQVKLTSGAGWRAYLDTMGSTGSEADMQARDLLERLQRIVMGLEDMGLAPDEAKPAISRILGEVRPPQVSTTDFEQAVRGVITLSAK